MAKLTDSEWKVLNALWAGGPQTLGQVLERLEGDTGWSRTTVHTYLTRMMGKGLVSADEHSPRRYSAAVTLEECAAQEERSLMDRAYGGRRLSPLRLPHPGGAGRAAQAAGRDGGVVWKTSGWFSSRRRPPP